jgi:hypothetical protein
MVREVFGPGAVPAWQEVCERLWALPGLLHPDNLRTHVQDPVEGRGPDRLDPVIDLSSVFRRLALDPRVLSIAARLLADRPALFKDKLIFKPPGMRGYDTHQDYAYWQWLPAPPASLLTVVIGIDAADSKNGALELFPGRHHRLFTAPGEELDIDESDTDLGSGELVLTAPGDIVIFQALVPHRSGVNRSVSPRRQLFFSYSARHFGDLYQFYYEHRRHSLYEGLPDERRGLAFYR